MTEQLPFLYQFTAGAIAGISEICILYPLDVVKTRLQLSKVSGQQYQGLVDCFKNILIDEGPFRFYRGIIAPIMVEAPKRATKFAANEELGQIYKELFGIHKHTLKTATITGISAGIIEAFVVVPFELVKIRMQDKSKAILYKNTLDCVFKIYIQEGIFNFYKGLESTLWRHAAWNGGYFGSIHLIREQFYKKNNIEKTKLTDFIAGTVGGTVGTILNTPFDVAKTRIQSNAKEYSSLWTLYALKMVYKNEGLAGLYRGFLPKILRLGPGGGIMLIVFEAVISWMKKGFHNSDMVKS